MNNVWINITLAYSYSTTYIINALGIAQTSTQDSSTMLSRTNGFSLTQFYLGTSGSYSKGCHWMTLGY